MEQLISMRQRIKSVQTIQKITQAMRLISISTHSRLSNKKLNLEKYRQALFELYLKIQANLEAKPKFTEPNKNISNKNLIILVGSQKGLAGTFNSHLFKFFEKDYDLNPQDDIITIGKIVSDYIKKNKNRDTVASYDIFNSINFAEIANYITTFILDHALDYDSVILYANHPKTFFLQEPSKFILLPFQQMNNNVAKKNIVIPKDYEIDQPDHLIASLEKIILSTIIQNSLFNSLLAEQSARFLSMDTATRNADNLITSMQTSYNKLRQASITKEITEVTSGMGS